jgi:drug/metabolite transporter (DMT)-like permease
VVGLTQVVFALALDVALFGHRVRPEGLLGMALVVGPTVWLMTHREVLHGPDGPADAIPLDGSP